MNYFKGSKLGKLLNILEKKIPQGENIIYSVPEVWNTFGYNGAKVKENNPGVVYVNPYKFYHQCIKKFIMNDAKKEYGYGQSIALNSKKVDEAYECWCGDWVKRSSIYSMHVRTSTSWDHDECGGLNNNKEYAFKETGTFVKSIALIPVLKRMGINTIYLLPIAQHSVKNKKGEQGSPYAVKNFTKIDEELKDSMTGNKMTVEEEFGAFVEACHMVGIKVMIDIIPRTCARDNDLILDHPDWFYWVFLDKLNDYRAPNVPGVGENIKPTNENVHKIYESQDTRYLLSKFTYSPEVLNPDLWQEIRQLVKTNKDLNVLDLLEQRMGITTAPAFSDCINDPQPPWGDVTYLRMYLDNPVQSRCFIDEYHQPPYILNDVIKSNLFKGDRVNTELWDTLSDIIPFYQRNFGIDGARIDMGHALPCELVEKIIKNARDIDGDFCFIAEELSKEAAKEARRVGYNMIIGYGFYMEPRIEERLCHEFLYDSRFLEIPVFATGETADTQRLVARKGGGKFVKTLTVLNHFMPNGIPFINSGLEIFEIQPMNTGLDCVKDEEWIRLNGDDKYNGKLAFFDKYQFHWTNEARWEMINVLECVGNIRNKYIENLSEKWNFYPLWLGRMDTNAIGFGWKIRDIEDNNKEGILVVIGNLDMYNDMHLTVSLDEIRRATGNYESYGKVLYGRNECDVETQDFDEYLNLRLSLIPGEVKIIKI